MEYDHFAYGEALASALKAISHTSQKKRFFTAFGLEDLISLDDSLSSINGTILIAVDGCESESEDNEADSLTNKSTHSSWPETQFPEIRKRLIRQPNNARVYVNRSGINC